MEACLTGGFGRAGRWDMSRSFNSPDKADALNLVITQIISN